MYNHHRNQAGGSAQEVVGYLSTLKVHPHKIVIDYRGRKESGRHPPDQVTNVHATATGQTDTMCHLKEHRDAALV